VQAELSGLHEISGRDCVFCLKTKTLLVSGSDGKSKSMGCRKVVASIVGDGHNEWKRLMIFYTIRLLYTETIGRKSITLLRRQFKIFEEASHVHTKSSHTNVASV